MVKSYYDRYKEVMNDPSKIDVAIDFLRNAIRMKNVSNSNELADILVKRGNPEDLEEALILCKSEMDKGNLWAQGRIARYYRDGIGVNADLDKAIELMAAPAEAGIKWAVQEYEAMLLIRNSDDDKKALFRIYLISAIKGEVWSQIKAARCYASGTGTEKDLGLARAFYTVASDKNDIARHELVMLPKN